MFINLSKALDGVRHRILVKVLIDLGIHCCLSAVINTYLTNRQKFVDVNGANSGLLDISSEVPQGPLFYFFYFCFVYFNSLLGLLVNGPVQTRMFDDDCVIYTPVSSVQ